MTVARNVWMGNVAADKDEVIRLDQGITTDSARQSGDRFAIMVIFGIFTERDHIEHKVPKYLLTKLSS